MCGYKMKRNRHIVIQLTIFTGHTSQSSNCKEEKKVLRLLIHQNFEVGRSITPHLHVYKVHDFPTWMCQQN